MRVRAQLGVVNVASGKVAALLIEPAVAASVKVIAAIDPAKPVVKIFCHKNAAPIIGEDGL